MTVKDVENSNAWGSGQSFLELLKMNNLATKSFRHQQTKRKGVLVRNLQRIAIKLRWWLKRNWPLEIETRKIFIMGKITKSHSMCIYICSQYSASISIQKSRWVDFRGASRCETAVDYWGPYTTFQEREKCWTKRYFIFLTLIWVGFLGVHFEEEWGGGTNLKFGT